jgi:hypothetical protein
MAAMSCCWLGSAHSCEASGNTMALLMRLGRAVVTTDMDMSVRLVLVDLGMTDVDVSVPCTIIE